MLLQAGAVCSTFYSVRFMQYRRLRLQIRRTNRNHRTRSFSGRWENVVLSHQRRATSGNVW